MSPKSISRWLSCTLLLGLFACLGPARCAVNGTDVTYSDGQTPGKNPRLKRIKIIQQAGSRARWSPNGQLLVFDRMNADGYFDLYLMTPDGQIVRSLTEGNPLITQKSNGNAIFHPSGEWIIFISEEPSHYLDQLPSSGDSGIGLYSNLWAVNLDGTKFHKLTTIPIKQTLVDGIETYASVNPVISADGKTLVWTQRYGTGGNWGLWRLLAADVTIQDGRPSLTNGRVLYTPAQGNYVTAMRFVSQTEMLIAGNLDAQHEFYMDQYLLDLRSLTARNLTRTTQFWEEGSTLLPDCRVVYMSNKDSRYAYDIANPNWHQQAMEREYYLTDTLGSEHERLTYFNDPTAPEYTGLRIATTAVDSSPDGRYLAATLGVDFGTDSTRVNNMLKVALLEFNTAPQLNSPATAAPASAEAGTPISLACTASDLDGDSLSYQWDFGDGASGEGSQAVHVYNAAGTYSASVRVDDGHRGSVQSSVQVLIASAPGDGTSGAGANAGDGQVDSIIDLGSVNLDERLRIRLPLPAQLDGARSVRGKATVLPAKLRVSGTKLTGKTTQAGTFVFNVALNASRITQQDTARRTRQKITLEQRYRLTVLPDEP